MGTSAPSRKWLGTERPGAPRMPRYFRDGALDPIPGAEETFTHRVARDHQKIRRRPTSAPDRTTPFVLRHARVGRLLWGRLDRSDGGQRVTALPPRER